MNRSLELDKLGAALAAAQGEIKDALKTESNPFFKSKYADLASVWEVCRAPLSKNGLSVIQSVSSDNEHHYLETTLLHASGQFVSDILRLKVKDDSMQGLGSAITYARRYQLSAFAGVAPDDDDDGNLASGKARETPRQTAQDVRTATKVDLTLEYLPPSHDEVKAALVKSEARTKLDADIKQGLDILGILPAQMNPTFKAWGFIRETGKSFTDVQAAAILEKIQELVRLK